MKYSRLILILGTCLALLMAVSSGWAKKDKDVPPPSDGGGGDSSEGFDNDGYYFWKLGHMDGPHDASMALGISRDGKVAVGATDVVDFYRAWRMDVDWVISTEEYPPLYNELQVQEDIGVVAPSQPSAAYAASNMTCDSYTYDISDKENRTLDWCGSFPVGTLTIGKVSYGIEWLDPALDGPIEGDEFTDGTDYWTLPDFGGGLSDMKVTDASADGLILVGTGNTKTGPVAFRTDTTVLDEEEGVPMLVQLTIQDSVTLQTLRYSSAQAVSADGSIIAGFGGTKRGNRAFVTWSEDWNAVEPVVTGAILPMLGGGKFAEAYDLVVTPEGLIVVAGRSDSPKGPQACIWFQDTVDDETTWVVKGIGGLSKKSLDSVATGIAHRPDSEVGDFIVVGRSQSILYDSEALVWTGNAVIDDEVAEEDVVGYLYDLEYILIKTGAAAASAMGSDWILSEATGISVNDLETRIVGYGVNPEGGLEAWLVTGFPYDLLDLTYEE